MARPSSTPGPAATARSPFAGCAILVAAVGVMIFLIGFSTLTLFRQYAEIEKFTASEPAPLAVESLEGREAELNDLSERIEAFRAGLSGEAEGSLELSVAELNLAIAAYEALRELRGTFRIEAIREDEMEIAISFPLNGKPRRTREGESGWITSDPRHLNGTLRARPLLMKGEVSLRIESIEVPGAEVPKEFVEQMSPYRITERYVSDPQIGPAMAALTGVEMAEGKLIFRKTPGQAAAGTIDDASVNQAGRRLMTWLGVAACLFLAFVATMIFLASRNRNSGNPG
jgi:hypothetical protein